MWGWELERPDPARNINYFIHREHYNKITSTYFHMSSAWWSCFVSLFDFIELCWKFCLKKTIFSETDFFEKSISLSCFFEFLINAKNNYYSKKTSHIWSKFGNIIDPRHPKTFYNTKDKNTIQTLNSFPFMVAQ